MATELGRGDYMKMAQGELDMAASATVRSIKATHLDKAAEYATLAERSIDRRAIPTEDDG